MENEVGHWCWGGGARWGSPGEWLALWTMLMVAEGPVHGYEILSRLHNMGREVNPGSLYRSLRMLEAQGLVESRWSVGGGPARRLYRLTPEGWSYLKSLKGLLEGEKVLLERVIKRIEMLEKRR